MNKFTKTAVASTFAASALLFGCDADNDGLEPGQEDPMVEEDGTMEEHSEDGKLGDEEDDDF